MTTKANELVPLGHFREIEHTGDTGIEITAKSRTELFRQAALGLAALLVDPTLVEPAVTGKVLAASAADPDLLHDLLAQLLNLFLLEAFIWRDVSVEEVADGLRVKLKGERFDPRRHNFRGEIKAITYHQLAVERLADGWHARLIFDV
jgi:SHS2 domain-containing protein